VKRANFHKADSEKCSREIESACPSGANSMEIGASWVGNQPCPTRKRLSWMSVLPLNGPINKTQSNFDPTVLKFLFVFILLLRFHALQEQFRVFWDSFRQKNN
jgi:hypothetical protein